MSATVTTSGASLTSSSSSASSYTSSIGAALPARDREPVWLVELLVGGTWRRYAHADEVVETSAGDELVYHPGLASEPAGGPGDESFGVELLDPSAGWAELHDLLEETRCRLLLWRRGTLYEQAEVWADGLARGIRLGAPYEPLSLELDQAYVESSALMPDDLARVDEATWPAEPGSGIVLPEGQIGVPYPIIIGYPGYTEGSAVPRPVVPVPLGQIAPAGASTSLVIVSERWLPDLQQVWLASTGVSPAEAGWQSARAATDLIGREVTVVDFVDSIDVLPASTDAKIALHAGFHADYGGGLYRGAYDVIRWMLRTWASDSRIDWDRMPGAEALNTFKVDTWINAQVRPWEWIEKTLLPFLPARIRDGGRGRYLELVRVRATESDAIGTLSADDGDIQRASPIDLTIDGELVNELAVDFARLYSGAWTQRRVLTAASSQLARTYGEVDERVLGSPIAAHSQSRFGRRVGTPVQLGWCWDASTAVRVLEHRLDRSALPYRKVLFDVGRLDVRSGEVYLLTDSEVGLSSTPAIVDGPPVRGPDGVVATFRIPAKT